MSAAKTSANKTSKSAAAKTALSKTPASKNSPSATKKPTPSITAHPLSPFTLCIDIGGTGLKVMVLDAHAKPITERQRELTPEQPTPQNILAVLDAMQKKVPSFDRVSVGFPGVIMHGHTLGAFNLDPAWANFPLEQTLHKMWKRPVRVANDAAIQGLGAIHGKGVELCLTLGTGLGSSLFVDGHLCPGLELAHHPWRKKKTYEDDLGRRGLEKHGKEKWNKHVARAIQQTEALFNWDALYLGGGNAKHLTIELPANVRIVPNTDGLLGGVALWRETP